MVAIIPVSMVLTDIHVERAFFTTLTRICHQDHGSRRRPKPACLTRWTSPQLIFESTKNFAQSEIHKVIPLLRKILCASKSRRDHPAPG